MTSAKPLRVHDLRLVEANSTLRDIESRYSLIEMLRDDRNSRIRSCAEAYQDIRLRLMRPGEVLALAGLPCAGKSTLLKRLEEKEEGVFIDEFWYLMDGFDEKKKEAEEARNAGRKIVIAAAQPNPALLDRMAYLHCPQELRMSKLAVRGQRLDHTRIMHHELFCLVDLFTYEVQQPKAELIIDSSNVSY